MEVIEPPVFQDVMSKYKTARDVTQACVYCLIPLPPRGNNKSLLLCEDCEEKRREEKRPRQESDDSETVLSTANISLTLGDSDDTENNAFGQLDKENDLQRLFLRVENELTRDDFNGGLLNTNESRSRSRIIEIVKRVLKTCGYVVAAVIGFPLIAGAGAVSIVVITIAGALSPPVILAIAKHRKLTSNQWWTYTRRERYYAIVWGLVMGTIMLPLLAPWGIYKLFKILGTKLLHNTIYWLRLLDSRCRGVQGEETDERYRDWPMESVDTRQERALFVLNREKTTINGCQSSADPEKMQMVPRQPIPTEAFGYNKGFLDEDNCWVEENLADVNGAGVILGSTEEDDDELGDFEGSCRKCTGTVWKPAHGRNALSDEENDDGRRDTQRLWARKAVSDTFFHVKKADEDFKARERVNSLCPAHRHETNQAFNGEENPLLQVLAEWRMSKESRNKDEAGNSVISNGLQNTDKGEGMSSALQCQDIKDLPGKGPKKTKKRRKRRTDKQLMKKNLDSSCAIEANEPLLKEAMEKGTLTPQLSVICGTAEAEQEETAVQAEKKIPRKSRKGKQPACEMTEEMLNQREKRKTKTKKAKHHEELPTHTARGQIACRFTTTSPKKYQPEKTDCSKPQKSHETRNKNPSTVSSNGEGIQVETKRRGSKLERMNAFSMKMDDLKTLKSSATVVSSTSSQQDQQDIVALFDEID